MKYCKSYCEEKEISASKLNEAQKTLYYIAESMKVSGTIGKEGYRHFQEAIEALEQEPCDYYDTHNKTCRRTEVPKEQTR